MSAPPGTMRGMDVGSLVGIVGVVIAAAALAVAGLARRDSKRSADAADRSAQSSKRSADASERAVEISELEARRRVERTDVVWRHFEDKSMPGLFVWRNDGTTTAHDVTAVVYVLGERYDVRAGDLAPGEEFRHDARDVHARKSAWRETRDKPTSTPGGFSFVIATDLRQFARIAWSSELGTPSTEVVPNY